MQRTLTANAASHTLPSLPYSYDALDPYIDARTMEIHHTKHHKAYLVKLDDVLARYPALQSYTAHDLRVSTSWKSRKLTAPRFAIMPVDM